MPTSVFVAVTSVSVLCGLNCLLAFHWAMVENSEVTSVIAVVVSVIVAAVAAIFITGLVGKSRLTWQWGRFSGAWTAIWAIVALCLRWNGDGSQSTVAQPASLLVSAVLSVMMVVALSRRTARDYYRLICPYCASHKVRAVDFWFTTAKCRNCDTKF